MPPDHKIALVIAYTVGAVVAGIGVYSVHMATAPF